MTNHQRCGRHAFGEAVGMIPISRTCQAAMAARHATRAQVDVRCVTMSVMFLRSGPNF
jgi:hypothetical protein